MIKVFKWNAFFISSDLPFMEWHVRFTLETFISPSFLKQEMHFIYFCRETTNKKNQFSKWETWIFNEIRKSFEGYCCELELILCLQSL